MAKKRVQIWLDPEVHQVVKEFALVVGLTQSEALSLLATWRLGEVDTQLKGWATTSEQQRIRQWQRSSTKYRVLMGSRHCK